MLILCLTALFVYSVFAEGNRLCDNKETRLPTTARLTCDGAMLVYVDGIQIKQQKSGFKNAKEYNIPIGSVILAIYCRRLTTTVFPRILGEIVDVSVTGDTGWLCTNQYYPHWNTTAQAKRSWPAAVVRGKNGDIPHGSVVNISMTAKWIEAVDSPEHNDTLYCRYLLCPMQACSSITATRMDGHKLLGHVFFTFAASSLAECALECAAVHNDQCQSFNYISHQAYASCELNNSTQILSPKNFVPAEGAVFYYRGNYP